MSCPNCHRFMQEDEDQLFYDELQECIQEKSADDLDKFLSRHYLSRGSSMTEETTVVATCDTTIENKLRLNESPIPTARVLLEWGCDLSEQNFLALRAHLLYCFCDREHLYKPNPTNQVVLAKYDLIEFFLDNTTVKIQDLDCRNLGHSEQLLRVVCPRSVDWSISCTFRVINHHRSNLHKAMVKLLKDIFGVGPYHEIVADYCYSPYIFKYDEDDYDDNGDYNGRMNEFVDEIIEFEE